MYFDWLLIGLIRYVFINNKLMGFMLFFGSIIYILVFYYCYNNMYLFLVILVLIDLKY